MARRSRRNHSPAFKAKVALLAIRGELTMAELSKKFDIHANLITQWKTQLLQNAVTAFDGSGVKIEEIDVERLHAKIGQLTLENDFLEGARARRRPERKAMIDRDHGLAHAPSRSSRTLPWLAVLRSDRTIEGRLGTDARDGSPSY